MPHQYPTVEIPSTAFHLVGMAVRVPTVAAMNTLLPTWEDAQPVLGPFNEGDPETEVVRPRHIQLVPGRYASILIHRQRVRPKHAYQEVVGAIEAHLEVESCRDVITWLRAACTARGGGGAQNGVPSVLHVFPALHLPPEAYRYVTMKVQADLPALGGLERDGDGGGAAAIFRSLGLARAVADAAGGDDAGRARAPKTIAEVYKETYTTLLRYCDVADVGSVAPIWSRLANSQKSEQHNVLTQEMQKVCRTRGLSVEWYTPVITTSLKQMVVGFQFSGHGVDDLASGCQPFLVAYAGQAHHYSAIEAASVSNQLSQGKQNASLSDYQTIREKEKIKFPRDIDETCITLARFAVLCQCLFQGTGPAHPFVEAMWALVAGLQNGAPIVKERFYVLTSRHPAVALLYHARIVRAVQVTVHEYMQRVACNVAAGITGVDVPSFPTMLQELQRGTFHNSTNWIDIPDAYLDPLPTQATLRGVSVITASGGASTAATHVSTRSGMSSLTTETRTTVARIDNPAGDAELAGIPLRAGGTRHLLREHRPPANDAGNEFCVAWWTKGGCFPICGRRATHVPFASAGERNRLLAYVRAHLQVPAAANAGSAT